MAKTEKTTTEKRCLVDFFGDIIGEICHKLSVAACGDGIRGAFCKCYLLWYVSSFVLNYCYFFEKNRKFRFFLCRCNLQ